jgi:tetratricopeptide (TPR) repeat protein
VQFLDRALRDLRDRPLFVLALARPEVNEVFPSLWADCAAQEIRLRELSKKAIEQLIRHIMGNAAGPDTVDRLARLSEGNAFYLEELIRWAAEGQGAELPVTVVAMVQSRLAVLEDESRRLLRAASIFGEVFWTGAVAALLGARELTTPVRERLSSLVDQEVLVKRRESRFQGEEEYAFRHALLREGAYGMLTADDLSLGHKLGGEWLAGHGEQDALLLAEHFEKGGDGEQAGHYYLQAANRASLGSDSQRAIVYLKRGLACAVPPPVRIRLLGMLCAQHYYRVELVGAALPYAEELLRTADPGSAPWVQALMATQTCAATSGKQDEFAAALHDLMTAEVHPDALEPAVFALVTASYILDLSGNIRRANVVIERAEALVRPAADRAPETVLILHLDSALRVAYAKGDPWMGLLHGRSGAEQARAIGHRTYLHASQVFGAMNAWFLGAHAEVEQLCSEVSSSADGEFGLGSSIRPFTLAWMRAELGALDEARAAAEGLIQSGQARGLPLDEARGHWALAELLRRRGALDTAETEIQAALAVFAMACPLDHPGALATLAALRLAQGRLGEALAIAEDAMAKDQSMAACSQFCRGAFLRLVHAECLQATGNHNAAKAAIAKAKARLLTIADKIPDPEYRKSFLENVPENQKTLELAQKWLE